MIYIIFAVIFLLTLTRKIQILYIDKTKTEESPNIDDMMIEVLNPK